MRLDKYLSQATGLSRSQVRKLIKAGEVFIDGTTRSDPALSIEPQMRVSMAGTTITPPGLRYFMLNKPSGYVSATTDRDHPTVIDLLWQEPHPEKLQIAGRLDIDATGLLLITDDGQWNHRLTSPRTDTPKTYRVRLTEALTDQHIAQMRQGIFLRNEKRRTKPAELTIISPHEACLTVSEGRYHQVKRMFAALGNHVEALHREQIGPIKLDLALEAGQYRALRDSEIANI